MRPVLLCALAALALAGCADPLGPPAGAYPIPVQAPQAAEQQDHLTALDEAMETALTVADLADTFSAAYMLERGLREKNPILGPRPSVAKLALYTGATVAANEFLFERVVPSKELRILARLALTGMELYFAGLNIDYAIRFGR